MEEFESALKDVVSTKRASVSRMNRLSEAVKKCFENDAQMVSMLYRTHKSLQPQFKVPSLYAFDALARAARAHALKHGFVGEAKSGNSATFLLKLEAVLEGLFQDMMSSTVPEGKEKAKKILDIWTKSTTFPPAVLTRLENVLKGDDAPVPAPLSDAVIEPVIRSAPPQAALNPSANAETPADSASQAASVHATLLALLSQASIVPMSTDGPQIAANNAQVQLPHLDANQLKLFQQLTQTEVTPPPIQTFPSPPPAPTTAPSESEFVAGPSKPYWNNLRGAPEKPWDAGQVGNNYQASTSVEENNYHGQRGRFRGGYRSRGRGRYADRDREGFRDRFYDTARSPPGGHGRESRSRSPPRSRYGGAGRRDVKPYSPPHRPSIVDRPDLDGEVSSSHRPGVDEFGREIRPSSDDDRSETPDDLKPRPAPPPPAHLSPTSAPAVEGGPVSGGQEPSAIPTPQAASAAGSSEGLHHVTGEVGLQSFDYSSFDPTLPSSWEALGNAWAATNGRQPLQEELMMFVMEFTACMAANQVVPTAPPAATQATQWAGTTGQRWMGGDTRGSGGPPRGGRGRGGAFGTRGGRRGFNAGGNGQTRWDYGGDGYADANGTDAIVLGEHTNNDVHHDGSGWAQQDAHHEQAAQVGAAGEEGEGQMANHGQGQGATGGRMQKVGDNWVFVRKDGSS